MAKRQVFSSHPATLMTMLGVSIGLGNVWRFPYMMGKYGGSAFLIVYLIFTLIFAIPSVMAEWALGRETRKGPIGAFSAVCGPFWGHFIGYILLITVLVANSYYLVVISNVIFTTYFSVFHGFTQNTIPMYERLLSNGFLQYLIGIATLSVSLYVIKRGLNRGIESISKIIIPFFAVIMFFLVISALSFPGALPYFIEFLKPDFSSLKAVHIFAALGQAFYSLGLGGTFLLIYGSYLRSDQEIPKSAIFTALGDMGAALNASLFIVPSILVFGLDMSSGPQLIFFTLPRLFSQMPFGQLSGSGFLISLAMVAFLSNIAALEVIVGGINDAYNIKLKKLTIIIILGIIEAILMLPNAFYPSLIEILDLVFGSGMQVFGSALAVLAVTWGLGKKTLLKQIFGSAENKLWNDVYFLWLKWGVPSALIVILIGYIYSTIY